METPSPRDIHKYLSSLQLPSIPEQQLNLLNAPISAQEVCTAVNTIPKGKAPGPDSFSGEYYQTFSSTLAPHLCGVFNRAMECGEVPPEMLQATVVALPKPGKTPDSPANFRPISLLNTNIKLYAKRIATRLLPVLPSLIHPDQVGFMKGRQAPDGTRRLMNLISVIERAKTPAIFLSLDAKLYLSSA